MKIKSIHENWMNATVLPLHKKNGRKNECKKNTGRSVLEDAWQNSDQTIMIGVI